MTHRWTHAYARYERLDALAFKEYWENPGSPRSQRLAALSRRAYERYVQCLFAPAPAPARRGGIPPAPVPEYGIVLGVAVATFKDGTTWLQTGPERWVLVVDEVAR